MKPHNEENNVPTKAIAIDNRSLVLLVHYADRWRHLLANYDADAAYHALFQRMQYVGDGSDAPDIGAICKEMSKQSRILDELVDHCYTLLKD